MNLSVSRFVTAMLLMSATVDIPSLAVHRDSLRSAIQRTSISGTYRIALCKNAECAPSDTLHAVVWGLLVLGDKAVPDSLTARFPDNFLGAKPNGCYALRHSKTLRSLAGLESDAVTLWKQDATHVYFTLYRSPDAAHDVRVIIRGDTLHGTGSSWGPGKEDSFPTDFVRAIRIGPADFGHCHPVKRHPVNR